jgi:hypothetical protein
MIMPKTSPRILFVVLLLVLISGGQVLAQTSTGTQQSSQADKKDDETNLDTQLYLLVATNQDVDDAKLPAALESVIRQLRASLPYKNYRLTATLINRVKNNGQLSLRWPMMSSVGPSGGTLTPSFNEFRLNGIKLVQNAAGQQLVRIDGFMFGARVPIQTGMTSASTSLSMATINYESTGLNTDISMREGEPVIVGTLNVGPGPTGEAIILVIMAKRTTK